MTAESTTRTGPSVETEPESLGTTLQCVVCDSRRLEVVHRAEIDRLDQVSFSYSFSPDHAKTFQVMRCTACTHLFCAPLPDEIAKSYEEVVDEEYLKHGESRVLAADAVLKSVLRHADGRRLLDVGCATGDFLTSAKRLGFNAEGLELSTWSCGLARERGLTVHQETLSAFAERDGDRYDVISLIGVVEHFAKPRVELANIAKLLNPGGLIVMWTGDVSSWLLRILGRRLVVLARSAHPVLHPRKLAAVLRGSRFRPRDDGALSLRRDPREHLEFPETLPAPSPVLGPARAALRAASSHLLTLAW